MFPQAAGRPSATSPAPCDVLSAACATPAIFDVISLLPCAASLTFLAISFVVAFCSSTPTRSCSEMSLICLITLADRSDRLHCRLRVRLDRLDLPADVLRRLGGFLGQFLHLVGHHRETFARFSGSRCFNRRVERQQVRLLGDRRDHFDHLPDLGARFAQLRDRRVRLFRNLDGRGRDLRGLGRVLRDFLDARAHLLGAGRDRLKFWLTCWVAAETTLAWPRSLRRSRSSAG